MYIWHSRVLSVHVCVCVKERQRQKETHRENNWRTCQEFEQNDRTWIKSGVLRGICVENTVIMVKILKKVNLQNLFRTGNVAQFGIVLAQEEKTWVQVVFAVPLEGTDQHCPYR